MLLFLTASLILVARDVLARLPDTLTSTLTARQRAAPSPKDCNATCAAFTAVKKACNVPHCGCTDRYLQAQGECLLCQTETPEDAASVQIFLDAEVNQCHEHGIPINFRLDLPPEAEAIIDKFDRQSVFLRHLQRAFLALQIAGGHVGLIIVLIFAIFSRRVHRDPTFFNFCITWVFSSVVFSIPLYRGTDGNTAETTLGAIAPHTCLVQAALTNGAQVMTACSTMALITQLWIGLRSAIHGDIFHGPRQRQWITIMLIGLPYVLFLAFVIPSISAGKPGTVIQGTSLPRAVPANFYCINIQATSLLRSVYGTTLAFLIIATVFDALIITMLYRHWKTFRCGRRTKDIGSVVSLSILLRVIVFSLYRVVVAAAYGTVLNVMRLRQILPSPVDFEALEAEQNFVVSNIPFWVDMLQATIPLFAFLVFGINDDVLSGVMFCRRSKKSQF